MVDRNSTDSVVRLRSDLEWGHPVVLFLTI